jgi:hypothetical protein
MAPWRIFSSAAILILLAAWTRFATPFPDAAELLSSPEKHSGKTVYGLIEAKTVESSDEGFIVEQKGLRVRIVTPERDVPLGSIVDFRGRFEPPDRVHADAVHVMTERPMKIAVSILPALLCIPLVFLSVGTRRGTRGLRLKRRSRRA